MSFADRQKEMCNPEVDEDDHMIEARPRTGAIP